MKKEKSGWEQDFQNQKTTSPLLAELSCNDFFIWYLDPQAIDSVGQRTAGLEEDVF